MVGPEETPLAKADGALLRACYIRPPLSRAREVATGVLHPPDFASREIDGSACDIYPAISSGTELAHAHRKAVSVPAVGRVIANCFD